VEHDGARRIALVAPTASDARDLMMEGESGILNISPPWNIPIYEPSKRRLTWPNRAIATTYSAEEPDRLNGPQHDTACMRWYGR
jgi:phage terminase large subunit-like protein